MADITGTITYRREIPPCDICGEPAKYDAKTYHGPWANMCQLHYFNLRAHMTLGIGKGQKIVQSDKGD